MPKNLLLADDSVTIQTVVAITFAKEDYAVSAVGNGEDALAKARAARPDVILLDATMPKKNGYEACEAIKADPSLAGVPVILLAGTFEPFDEARAKAVRADAVIQKPFESQALINKVRELVEGRAPVTALGATPLAYGAPGSAPPAPAPAPPPAAAAPRPFVPPAAPQPAAAPPPARPAWSPAPAAARPPLGAPPQPPAGARPPPGAIPPAAARPPGAAPPSPAATRPPLGAVPPPGARPPPGAMPPPGARPPPGAVPPPGARPPPGAVPPSGVRPPPGAVPPPGARPPPGQFSPPAAAPAAPPAAARPFAPPQPPAAPPKPFAPAPMAVQPTARTGPFGLDVAAPRPPTPAPPVQAAADDDWSDVEVTQAEPVAPRASAAAAPAAVRTPSPPAAISAPLPVAPEPEPTLELEPSLELEPAGGNFEPIDLPAEEPGAEPLLAPMHEFVPPAAITGHQPVPVVAQGGAGVIAGQATPADGGEAVLREALSQASREVIERVVWEVVPQLAEIIIRENLDRLTKARQG